ncbi:MAG TPA: hypothetical protein VFO67_11805 [Gemmatimonadales bacterium]|nr:hypothetical protein [Gemmatimonadales bacterium]
MSLSSSVVAILWETWRVTRVEAAWKLAFGIGGPLAVLALSAAFAPAGNAKTYEDAAVAMILLVLPHVIGWPSLARLNGGRPGFPLSLHYTRPVRTVVIVGLPMVYLAAVSWAIYLVSALLLRVASGYAFPLLPVAAWMAAFTLVWVAATWSTSRKDTQVNVMVLAIAAAYLLSMHRLTAVEIPGGYDWPPRLWPTLFDWPLTDYAGIALLGLVSFAVTVAGVRRQRRGEPWAEVPSAPRDGFRDRLINLFRFPCPTSSATRAQVWFDLKSTGLPLLTIGVSLGIVILLLGAVSTRIDAATFDGFPADMSCPDSGCFWGPARLLAALVATFSPLIVVFLVGNAFGIRRKHGRSYVSAFEATQAHGAAQLAALKLLVRSACFLAAFFAVSVSAWTTLSLLGDEVFIAMWSVPLSSQVRGITGAVTALTWYEQLALVVVTAVGVAVWVAVFAVLAALWTRYSRRATITASSLLLSGLALALLALAARNGIVSPFVFDALFAAARWIFFGAMVFTTVYVFWSGFAERVLTIRYASGTVAMSAAFGAAWLTVLHMAGVQLAGMSAINAVSILSPALLPPIFSALAPWSLSRARHT